MHAFSDAPLLALVEDIDFSALADEAFASFALGAFPALADTFSALASALMNKK